MHGTNQQIKECIDLRACAYSNWSQLFQKIVPESICIPLSDQMVDYLLDEIIILPKECYANDSAVGQENDDDSDDEDAVVVSVAHKWKIQAII